MTGHWKSLLAVLSCVLLLVACTENDDPTPPSDERDAETAQPDAAADGGDLATDAGEPSGEGPAATHLFLPTTEPDNTLTPQIKLDRDGGMHLLYTAHALGGAYYAYCPKNCRGAEDMHVVHLATEGTAHGMLQLTAAGKPRALLSTFVNLYYAECDGDCNNESGWTIGHIADLAGDRDVSGNAFALDPEDRPRFVIHTYLAFLGVGQKTPETWFAQCDADCTDTAQWRYDSIQTDIWYGSQLRYDTQGRAHLATGVVTMAMGEPTFQLGAYLVCEQDCTSADAWNGIGLTPLLESNTEQIKPSLALALTRDGQPRVVALANNEGQRRLIYYECDGDCVQDNWSGYVLLEHEEIGSGVALELDANDHPRAAFTLDDNIGLNYCDGSHCTAEDALWDTTKIELWSEVPPDNIILWPNCTIDAWFLHDPSLALTSDGSVRVGYQATDISGGVRNTDPTMANCLAGKDMVLSRLALLNGYK